VQYIVEQVKNMPLGELQSTIEAKIGRKFTDVEEAWFAITLGASKAGCSGRIGLLCPSLPESQRKEEKSYVERGTETDQLGQVDNKAHLSSLSCY
jgi:hypothetical protein